MNRSILGLALTALLTMTVQSGFAAEAVQIPATPPAAASANLIARADRALRDYVAACSTGDIEAFARIVTSDAVVEYALEEPGTYLAVEAAALSAKRSGDSNQTGTEAHISNLWLYPTSDSNVVFVHYTTRSDVRSPAQLPDSEHLALLEMRGDRIFKMRNLGANARTLSTLEASVVTRAISSSRASGQDETIACVPIAVATIESSHSDVSPDVSAWSPGRNHPHCLLRERRGLPYAARAGSALQLHWLTCRNPPEGRR